MSSILFALNRIIQSMPDSARHPPLSYRKAGVDIEKAADLVEAIKPIAKRTRRPGVLSGVGGFGGLFELPRGYKHPVLVSGTDGVGTKLKIAVELNRHNTIGIDLVAMCVNDVITTGAEPLFFLDYYATGHLNKKQTKQILAGIGAGCELAEVALIGGETAEMPGLYKQKDYDLAGFCVGVVEKEKIIDRSRVRVGDALVGIASSGPHSNGYSLIRKILARAKIPLSQPFENKSLGDRLLASTRIYVKTIKRLLSKINLHALAHITGGGLIENVPRVLPPYTQAVIDSNGWKRPSIFHWLQKQGKVPIEEMWRTFNMGVGMLLCLDKKEVRKTLELLAALGETAWILGEIQSLSEEQPRVTITP
ncbi:phosphoribosylformylglycinamidine cyclo-ligase [Coxiella endosymbiont of Ornithodoros amblus]|uniref:phosphoribosylformylglycinamidine cyclo-ligase n=1 Tax=Coxiella endosymbiont of Ornithodoros amblus TaxID=1656166 RepID=UPI00244DC982|nr:phosphoribosylformylglycinamidine cyclo-ligase [Coxiella endosymbiont of Ornithodoros amblus]MBW5802876.1 phosphoribosylformylglycinamidine cyclo-ligase [Coxiella endosymbiont of Ornithodoros amblus]